METFEEIIKSKIVTESTIDNISTLLWGLNAINWGVWPRLPKMTIGYSVNQYDCDGKIATTIKLDKKVDGETKYKVGGKRNHLNKYSQLR